jgi:hypothetical protein
MGQRQIAVIQFLKDDGTIVERTLRGPVVEVARKVASFRSADACGNPVGPAEIRWCGLTEAEKQAESLAVWHRWRDRGIDKAGERQAGDRMRRGLELLMEMYRES